MVSHLDIVPTLLQATGAAPSNEATGFDLLPSLRGGAPGARTSCIVECIDDPRKLRLKTIVTRNRKLTWYCGRDYGELYDLESDPQERRNLWHEPAYVGDRAALLGALLQEMEPLEQRAPRYAYA